MTHGPIAPHVRRSMIRPAQRASGSRLDFTMADVETFMQRPLETPSIPANGRRPDRPPDPRSGPPHCDCFDPPGPRLEPPRWHLALTYASFVVLFALLSPIYYLNRWDFKRKKKSNPFYASVRALEERYPLLYEMAMLVQ